jgi:putative Mn2+ efflux pump MntP
MLTAAHRAARNAFARRLFLSVCYAGILVGLSLFAGMAGYHFLEQMTWLDAFLNASMILSGMGPAINLQTSGGKFFAGCYAIYSGLVLILVTGLILAPIVHFVLHRFHLEARGNE